MKNRNIAWPVPLCLLGFCLAFGAFGTRLFAEEAGSKPTLLRTFFGLATHTLVNPSLGWPYAPGRWNWFTAVVRNPTEKEIRGTLTFRTLVPETSGQFILSRPFLLPPRSDGTVAVPIRVAPARLSQDRRFQVEAVLRIGDERVDSQKREAVLLPEDAHVLAVFDKDARLAEMLSGAVLYPKGGPEFLARSTLFATNPRDVRMPDDPLGLDLFRTVIIVHPSRRPFRALQWEALDGWASHGGDLIFVVGRDQEASRVTRVDAMLPVRLIGQRHVTRFPAAIPWSEEEMRVSGSGFAVSESLWRRGNVLLADGQNPLVVRDAHGAGSVTYVALDVDEKLLVLPSYRQFWVRLLEQLRRPELFDVELGKAELIPLMENLTGREVVGIWLPATVLFAYLAVVVGLMKGFGRTARLRALWGGICVAATVFAGCGLVLYLVAAPASSNSLFDLWVGVGDGRSGTMRYTGFLSFLPEDRGRKRLAIDHPSVRVVPTVEPGVSVTRSIDTDRETFVSFQAEKGNLRTLKLEGLIQQKGFRAYAQARTEVLAIRITNSSPNDLQGTFVKLGRRILPVGDLPQGSSKLLNVEPAEGPTLSETYERAGVFSESARFRQLVLKQLLRDRSSLEDETPLLLVRRGLRQGTGSQPFVAGWVNAPPFSISLSQATEPYGSLPTTRRSLGLIAVQPEFEVADEVFLVPKGSLTLDLPEQASRRVYFGKSAFRGKKPETGTGMTLRYSLPAWARPARVKSAALFVHFESEAFRLRVFTNDEEIDLPEDLSGKVAIPQAQSRFDHGTIDLRLEITPRSELKAGGNWQESPWFLREIEVECLCERRSSEGTLTKPLN